MNQKITKETVENYFLDYVEEKLTESERAAIDTLLREDLELQQSLKGYQKVIAMEEEIAREEHKLHQNFVVKVMERLEEPAPGFWSTLMKNIFNTKTLTGLATCAVLVVCIQIGVDLGDKTGPDASVTEQFDQLKKDEAKKVTTQPTFIHQEKNKEKIQPVIPTPLEQGLGDGSSKDDSSKRPSQAISTQIEDFSTGLVTKQSKTLESTPTLRTHRGIEEDLYAPQSNKMSGAATSKAPSPEMVLGGAMPHPHHQDMIAPRRRILSIPASTEQYGQWAENEPTLVADEAVSTFSIDVDTGSYTNARRYLNRGVLPPTSSVRIEEFINYFDYNYPVQTEKPFTLSYEIAPNPLDVSKHLLKLGIKARDAAESEKPWNLVFLVDVSGSMNSFDKLPLVQRSLKLLTNQMRPSDKVSLVTYAGYSRLVLPPTGINEKSKILNAIDSLRSGGGTHGSSGILEAYRAAENARISNGVNRVVLATDGDFNVGITNRNELIKLVEEKRRSGITLTTLGFGTGNYNEAMMEQIANKGNGNYFYIDSFKEARKVFETQLAGTMEVVAKDVKLQIEFNPAHVAQYRLIGYENRKLRKQDFNNDAIDAGEIGSGHTVTALYELVLTGTEAAKNLDFSSRYQEKKGETPTLSQKHSNELAFLKIRHKEPQGSTSKLLRFPIQKSDVLPAASQATDDFRFAAAVSGFGHLLRQSQYRENMSYDDVITLAQGSLGEDKHGYRREFVELVRNAKAVKQ